MPRVSHVGGLYDIARHGALNRSEKKATERKRRFLIHCKIAYYGGTQYAVYSFGEAARNMQSLVNDHKYLKSGGLGGLF